MSEIAEKQKYAAIDSAYAADFFSTEKSLLSAEPHAGAIDLMRGERVFLAAGKSGVVTETGGGEYRVYIRGYINRYSFFGKSGLLVSLGMEDLVSLCEFFDSSSDVSSVRFYFDTAGGGVGYVHEAAMAIRGLRAETVAYIDSMAASAGFWLSAQCDRIVVCAMSRMGSLGVISSVLKDDGGYVVVRSSNAPLKNADPETPEGIAEIQRGIDYIESIMISDIAQGRGVTVDEALAKFGQGGMIYGRALVDAGLADEYRESLSREESMTYEEKVKIDASEEGAENAAAAVDIDAVIAAERKRICGVISAFGSDMPEELAVHIMNGSDPGTVALEAVAKYKEEIAALRNEVTVARTKAATFDESKADAGEPVMGELNDPVSVSAATVELEASGKDVEPKDKESTIFSAAEAAWNSDPRLRSKFPKKEWYLGTVLGVKLKDYINKEGQLNG